MNELHGKGHIIHVLARILGIPCVRYVDWVLRDSGAIRHLPSYALSLLLLDFGGSEAVGAFGVHVGIKVAKLSLDGDCHT